MKDKNMNKSVLAFFAVLLGAMALCGFAGCSEYMDDKGTARGPLKISVSDDRYNDSIATRVVFSGFRSSFEDGDRIGIYVVNGTTHYADNVCYTYNEALGEWTTPSELEYADELTYYAYYPDIDTPYAVDYSGAATTDEVFAAFIADASEKFHVVDQSTKWAFEASNLMVAKGLHTDGTTVNFAMARQKGLAVFGGGDASEAVFSGENIPYKDGNMHYYNLKPSVMTTFTDNISSTYTLFADNGKYVYKNIMHDYIQRDYLTFVAVEDGAFSFSKDGLSYSLDDGSSWTPLAAGAYTPTVTAGNAILWKNNTTLTPGDMDNTNSMWAVTDEDDIFSAPAMGAPQKPFTRSGEESTLGIGTFSSTGKFNIEGNIMSLFYGDDADGEVSLSGKNCAFFDLFSGTRVEKAHRLKLPATTLTEYCYANMFANCTNLIAIPDVLPATVMQLGCYFSMFRGCSLLMSAPALPATTLAEDCYKQMFTGCISLIDAPVLPATTMEKACYKGMFEYCVALKTAPALPATTLAPSCYAYMFYNCLSLPDAPELPATILTKGCYQCMFTYCKKLVKAPFLPALTLVDNCYYMMFRDCESLNYIKAAFTTVPSERYTEMWTYQVARRGSYVRNKNATYGTRGWHGIPFDWTLTTYTP